MNKAKNILGLSKVYEKGKRKLSSKFVSLTRDTKLYQYLYRSYWHYLIVSKRQSTTNRPNYFAAKPHPGAGIGHQMANWIAGYGFSKLFGLKFAHIEFSSPVWESFLGFGDGEISVESLVKAHGYKKIRLPLFRESSAEQVNLTKKIIRSYGKKKVVFIAEQDQFYKNQFDVSEDLKAKFFHAKARQKESLAFSKNHINIAVHIRRGDIVSSKKNRNPNLLMRFQSNEYFVNVLNQVLKCIPLKINTSIYLFSQGQPEDFNDFLIFDNINFCLDMTAQNSFSHMVYADVLITSKSSFSYKPALLSRGIKISPKEFWHGYPVSRDWILADEAGNFDTNKLNF